MALKVLETDILIIGSGIAGLAAAIEAREGTREVLLVSKGSVTRQSCSAYSPGEFSFHLPVFTENGFRSWISDSPLTNLAVAQTIAKETEHHVQNLSRYGLTPHRYVEGRYRIRNLHSQHQFPGTTIISKMAEKATQLGIHIIPNFRVVRLLVFDGRCYGATGFTEHADFVAILAKAVILASGGACRIFRYCANPPTITGDGLAMLLKAGGKVANLEFIRFFPLGFPGLVHANPKLSLSFYKVDGLRAINDRGEDIFKKHMSRTIAEATEEPYDRFVRMSAVVATEQRSGDVYLDFRQISSSSWTTIASEDPTSLVRQWDGSVGIWRRILRDRVCRTTPIAQTFVGGAVVAPNMATGVEALFAAGEMVSFYFELGSTPRCEISPSSCALTSGIIAGREAVGMTGELRRRRFSSSEIEKQLKPLERLRERRKGVNPSIIIKEIRSIMTDHCGPLRSEASLREGLERLKEIDLKVLQLRAYDFQALAQAIEAENMALVSRAVLESALMRKESRSEHYREDFPFKNNDQWAKSIVIGLNQDGSLTFPSIP